MHNKNIKFNKRKIPLIASFLALSGILFSYLTFIPTQTFAAEETRTLADINYMQEMNKYVCDNTLEINEQYQLIDLRDNKKYWVSKLRDGNCWMTQNLDFDVPAIISSETSNVGTQSFITNTTEITTIKDWGYSNSYATYNAYYDPGDYFYNGPDDSPHSQGSSCAIDGNEIGENATLKKCPELSQAGSDTRYHIGNYYSYSAATMKSGDNLTSRNAQYSVCPKGWRLPSSDTGNESFNEMLTQYGVDVSLTNGGFSVYGHPLYLVYGGMAEGGQLKRIGDAGDYWSSTATSYPDSALALYIGNKTYPSNSNGRGVGMSVRCVSNPEILTSKIIPIIQDDQANVAIKVSPVINLDVTKSANNMTVDFNSIDTSTIDINVSSNQKYQVALTTDQPNLTPQKSENSEHSIKMIGTNGGIVEKGKNGWGIKKKLSATNDNQLGSLVDESTYSPIGTNNDQIIFYRSAGPEALTNQAEPKNLLQLEVGVTVDQSLPSDTYSTMVTVTAMAY